MTQPASNQRTAMMYGLSTVLLWSTVATAFKYSLEYLRPGQLILIASIVSLIFLGICLRWQGKLQSIWRLSARDYWASFGFACLNPVLYYLVLLNAYAVLPAQEAQAINYTWAIVLSLLAAPMLGQKMVWSDWLALGLCYFGILFIATRGAPLSLEFANLLGVGLAVVSTVIWAFYWIFNRRDSREPIAGLFLNFLFAIPLLLVWNIFSGDLNELFTADWRGIAGAVYIGLFEMGLAFVLWLMAMKKATSTSQVANLIFIAPLFSLVWISLILKEPILTSTLYGLGFILAGLVIQQSFKAKIEA